jgi:hypothetical protein
VGSVGRNGGVKATVLGGQGYRNMHNSVATLGYESIVTQTTYSLHFGSGQKVKFWATKLTGWPTSFQA